MGTPSVIPGTDGLPSIAGLPMIITFVEIDAPGTGSTVLVVHGLLAGLGGTGHVVGFARDVSGAQRRRPADHHLRLLREQRDRACVAAGDLSADVDERWQGLSLC